MRRFPRSAFLIVLVALWSVSEESAAQDLVPAEPFLQRGFRELQLGTPYLTVQTALEADFYFNYRGEPDVSLAPGNGGEVIDTDGRGYVSRGLFQFQDGALYIIALYLDRQRLDYFQLYNRLQDRYGPPLDLNPQRAVWQDRLTRIELERPLTVRYLDLETFEVRRRERRALEAIEDMTREQFLEEF